MNQSTPPKHKTPNSHQVRHETRDPILQIVKVWWTWEAMPLRATRKDL